MKFWFGKSKCRKEEANPNPVQAKPAEESTIQPPPPEKPPVEEPPAIVVEPPAPSAVQTAAAARPSASSQNNRKTLYYQIMNALYDAILVLDKNGHIVDSNERVESVLGYARDDLWDVPVTEVVPALKAQIFLQMKEGLRNKRRVLVNARCRRRDGTFFHGEIGAGLMELVRVNLVLSIRNIEKRAPTPPPRKPAVILKTRHELAPRGESRIVSQKCECLRASERGTSGCAISRPAQ